MGAPERRFKVTTVFLAALRAATTASGHIEYEFYKEGA